MARLHKNPNKISSSGWRRRDEVARTNRRGLLTLVLDACPRPEAECAWWISIKSARINFLSHRPFKLRIHLVALFPVSFSKKNFAFAQVANSNISRFHIYTWWTLWKEEVILWDTGVVWCSPGCAHHRQRDGQADAQIGPHERRGLRQEPAGKRSTSWWATLWQGNVFRHQKHKSRKRPSVRVGTRVSYNMVAWNDQSPTWNKTKNTVTMAPVSSMPDISPFLIVRAHWVKTGELNTAPTVFGHAD